MDKPARLLSLLIILPALAATQTPQPIPAQTSMFEENSATEIVLNLDRPLRVPVISIDSLWEQTDRQ